MKREAARIEHHEKAGVRWTLVRAGNVRHVHVTLPSLTPEEIPSTFRTLGEILKAEKAAIVRQEVFGALEYATSVVQQCEASLGSLSWPLTWVQGKACDGRAVAGMHFYAIAGVEVTRWGGMESLAATAYQDAGAKHLHLGGLHGQSAQDSRPAQVRHIYERLQTVLTENGLEMADLIRTWFFLDEILDWYGEFNAVRNEVYQRKHLHQHAIPASTGIGASNPLGMAGILSAWAVKSEGASVTFQPVDSPLQGPAPGYGSCFSRAMELKTPGYRQLLISGTASIDQAGRTLHIGNFLRQVELTMEVVEAILKARQMTWRETTRATAYCKSATDATAFAQWCATHGLSALPLITTEADVCRPDLLFELELDAVALEPLKTT